ncbi:MAG: hypothetical protein ACHQAY_19170 [Hyphomicrobiales bacterium]
MKLRTARAAATLGMLALWLAGASEPAKAVEVQKTDPEQCQEDKACVEAWYKEYSTALIGEFKYYAGQEDFLAEMMAAPQETLLTAKLSLLLIEGGTKYSQWVPLKDEAVARNAGLDMARYQAILGACRDAISGMRTALFDLRQHRGNVRAEAGQYLKNAAACEKAFGLPPVISKLRSAGQPARALAPPAPTVAPQGPMDIRPAMQRP